MKTILIGIQGSGKSTQGNLLSKKLSVPYLATGQIFRDMAKEDSQWGRYLKETLAGGHLIPDDKTITIIEEYLKKPTYTNGYILDGFPRTVTQAKAFTDRLDHVLSLNVSDEEALKRLTLRSKGEKREDDTKEAIEKRISLFHEMTEPVLDYYRQKGLLLEVNGQQGIEDIHRDIVTALGLS